MGLCGLFLPVSVLFEGFTFLAGVAAVVGEVGVVGVVLSFFVGGGEVFECAAYWVSWWECVVDGLVAGDVGVVAVLLFLFDGFGMLCGFLVCGPFAYVVDVDAVCGGFCDVAPADVSCFCCVVDFGVWDAGEGFGHAEGPVFAGGWPAVSGVFHHGCVPFLLVC